jgi:nitronate monooxygenase
MVHDLTMLRSRFTEMFGLDYPLMSAPMALHSGGTLAGAVSATGGLGSFGGVHLSGDPNWIRSEVAKIRERTGRPFAIGFITNFIPFVEPLFEASLSEAPALIALSFGDPSRWMERCKGAGSRVICQVQTYAHADLAVEAGADVLVAQGTEAGGHTGEMSLLPLLAGVSARHPQIPLLAAGGVGDGRTLAAAMMAGADGAWLGTAFLATPEAVEIDDVHKQLIVQSDGADTVYTHVYDIVSGYPWPPGIGERVRRNSFTEEWADREAELVARREEVSATRSGLTGFSDEDVATREVLYGQSARFVTEIRPVAEVMRSICGDAELQLRARPPSLL